MSDRPTPRSRSKQSLRPWHWIGFAILIVAAAVYVPSLGGAPIWEDRRLIGGSERTLADCFRNPFLGTYFRPLITATFLVDRMVGGAVPFQYHQTNLILHVLTTGVLMGAIGASFRSRVAGLAGGLAFALQPAQVSSVAWIGGRTDSLCILFAAVYAWGLAKARDSESVRSKSSWTVVASLGFLAALLSKEQMVALLPLAPLAVLCDGRATEGNRLRATVVATVPMLIACIAFLGMWRVFGGKSMVLAAHDWHYRLTLAGQTLLHYFLLLAFPNPWSMHTVTTSTFHATSSLGSALLGIALAGGLCLVLVHLVRRRAIEGWWLAWAMLAIAPIANFIPVSSLIVAPYRASLAGVGVAGLVGSLALACVSRRLPARAMLAGYLAATGGLTVWGASLWTTEADIYRVLRRHDPGSLWVQEGVAATYMAEDRPKRASATLETWLDWAFLGRSWDDPKAIVDTLRRRDQVTNRIHASNGDKREPRTAVADVLTLLAYGRLEAGDVVGAGRALASGAAVDPDNPSVALARGRYHMRREEWPLAVREFDRSIAVNPRVPTTFILKGLSLRSLSRWRDAESAFVSATRLEPWVGKTWLMVAEMRERQGDDPGSRKALEEGRDKAHTDREEIMRRLGGGPDPGPSDEHHEGDGHRHEG
ncbi:MAG: hypothetical protein ACKO5K_14560 [Armatimonadota bacterium]